MSQTLLSLSIACSLFLCYVCAMKRYFLHQPGSNAKSQLYCQLTHGYLFLLYCNLCDGGGGLLSCHQCTARTDLYRGQGFSICLSPTTIPRWIKGLFYSKILHQNVENLSNYFLLLIFWILSIFSILVQNFIKYGS